MKKKIYVLAAVLLVSLALTACGNPLKMLPEADEDTNIYNVDDKTTGNDAADAIIKALKKDNVILKNVKEFYVEERKDRDSKEKSVLEVKIVSDDKKTSFENLIEVTMKYDEDNKEWKVKEYEEDIKDRKVIPLKGVEEDLIEKALTEYIFSVNMDGSTVRFEKGNFETDIKKDKIEEGKNNAFPKDTVSVNVKVDDGMCKYERMVDMVYEYTGYDTEYSWRISDYTWADDFEKEYSEEFKKFFEADNLINDIGNRDRYIFGGTYSLDKAMFDTCSVDECEVSSYDVAAPLTAHFKNNQFMDVSFAQVMRYSVSNGSYEFSYYDGNPEITVDYSKLTGDASATVYDKYDNTKEIGKINFKFDKASSSEITGTVKFVPSGSSEDSAPEITFKGAEYSSWGDPVPGMISLSLDESLSWEKYYTVDTIYLAFIPESGNLSSSNTNKGYFELTR